MSGQFWAWAAWRMPRQLVYWCAIRLGAHATTGEYGGQIVPDLTLVDALKRWRSDRPVASGRAVRRNKQRRGFSGTEMTGPEALGGDSPTSRR